MTDIGFIYDLLRGMGNTVGQALARAALSALGGDVLTRGPVQARELLHALAHHLPEPKVYHGAQGRYLSRWLLLDRGHDVGRVYLHRFHRGDEDAELHSHPWRWGAGVILAGGYLEQRRGQNDAVVETTYRPGDRTILTAETFHRVELLPGEPDCWTLFAVGPIVGSWGFWHPETKVYTPWRKFVRDKGLQVDGEPEPDHVVGEYLTVDGRAEMRAWLNNLASPWREVYRTIKARDPNGKPRGVRLIVPPEAPPHERALDT